MRRIPYYVYIFVISYIVYFFVLTTDFSWNGVSAEVKTKISESSKHVNKRSFEDMGYDLRIKTSSGQSNVRFFYTSPKSGYHEWGDVSRNDRSTDQGHGTTQQKRVNYFFKTDSATTQVEHPVTSSSASYSLTDIGCFYTWGLHNTSTQPAKVPFDENYTPASCAESCLQLCKQYQVVILKGAECRCTFTYDFNLWRAPGEDCYIPCPLKDFTVTAPRNAVRNSCGGNRAYSVYCRSGENNCSDITSRIQEIQKETNPVEVSEIEKSPRWHSHDIQLDEECAICVLNLSSNCKKSYIYPDFDYFPVNNPYDCVDYCSQNISYRVRTTSSGEQVREPKTYAVLMWWWWENIDKDLSICSCINEKIRKEFVPASNVSDCNQKCPGNPDEICGGLQRDYTMYATIYCVGDLVDGKCQLPEVTSTVQPSTSTTDPCSDGEVDCDPDPPSSTPDPCSDGEVDCDPDPPSTVEPCSDETSDVTDQQPTTTTTEGTSDDTPETTLETTTVSNTSDAISSTTPFSTTGSPPTTSSAATTPSSTTESWSCKTKCRSKDHHGIVWEVCGGTVGIKPCSKISENSIGVVFWKCLKNGSFETSRPDSSNCSSTWLEGKHDELKKVDDINEAREYINRLAESCMSAPNPDSNTSYFGHELRNITSLIGLTVEMAKGFTPSLSAYERVVKIAIDLSAFLMQYQDPWSDLSDVEKSSISTNLIDNTEDTLFHLTELAKKETYTQIYAQNPEDISKFLILAESFSKEKNSKGNTGTYEFPPSEVRGVQDSFIKLPAGWQDLIPSNKVDIAAMSIDSQYVRYMMPGQYKDLGAGSKVEVGKQKVINGRLISFTMLSSGTTSVSSKGILNRKGQNASTYFKGKGVEITFQHDTEAWGDAVHDIPRKLHEGENPKAVLGSTQCVYWDTKTETWSSNGCQIIVSNRYETVCECNHLTSFAVSMDIHRYVGKEFALEVLTLILCSLSTVALLLSVIILSSVSGLQRIRKSITKNLSACLMLGNAMVMFVLDRNYFRMSEGVCTGAAIVTHYIFLCAFMWMVVEGVQLYRMVVHVFDSGRSYIKHFGIFAYGTPLIVVAITATTGYLKGDKPYGGDVYCWLGGAYIWSFLVPVAIVITINLIILFIALKTAYQLQQNKKLSPTFIMGRVRSYKTWFKGSFSLTVILGLTWVVGFFTLMNNPGGIIAAYVFTLLNASQGIFIFMFHCLFNDKVRAVTRRNLSTYLPSWISSSVSTNPGGNDTSIYGKRPLSSMKSGESVLSDKSKPKLRRSSGFPEQNQPYIISKKKSQSDITLNRDEMEKNTKVNFTDARNDYVTASPVQRSESVGTICSVDSIPFSDTGNISSDTSHSALISKERSKKY